MAGAIKLMVILQIGPALVQAVDDIVRIQVAVWLLCGDDFLNGTVDDLFQFGIRIPAEGKGGAFDPLGDIAVLEDETGMFSLHFAGGDAEVPHTAAGLGAGDLIVEGFPLVGDAFAADRLTHTEPERVLDAGLFQSQNRFIHICGSPVL